MIPKGTPFHNSFRSYMYTPKGKRIGCSERWRSFYNFKEDMESTYFEGAVLRRRDPSKPFNKENCEWVSRGEESKYKRSTIRIEYDGKILTPREWGNLYGLSSYGITLRYHRYKDKISIEEILFGLKSKPKRIMKDANGLTESGKRSKASKMISTYFCRDKKRNQHHYTKPSIDWFVENIFNKKCVYCGTDQNVGADRIDNIKGHSMDNIVPCCYRCNVIRADFFSVEEMKKIGKFIADNIFKK